ncbi:MAG: hypothetical protein LBS23_03140 [Holosporaceae bacterium]|jgi:hypothetical protein|nr:hypothetical protein [Holosporaceae bacterium]
MNFLGNRTNICKNKFTVPCSLLFLTIVIFSQVFFKQSYTSPDAKMNIYLVAAYDEQIKRHFLPPNVLQASAPDYEKGSFPLNNVFPIYYGNALHTISGYLSLIFGPAYALFTILALTTFAALWSSYVLLFLRSGLKWASAILSMMSVFSIYSMQNLFIRGALAEYFATTCLFIAVCRILLWYFNKIESCYRHFWIACLFYALAINTHPITFYLSSIVVFFFSFFSLRKLTTNNTPQKDLLIFIGGLVLVLMSILHFILAFLLPSNAADGHRVSFTSPLILPLHPALNSLLTRLFPLPFDYRMLCFDFSQITVPYLDAQISVFVGFCVCFLLAECYRKRNIAAREEKINTRAAVVCLLMSFLILYFSVGVSTRLEYCLFSIIQFKYRLITYINLFMYMALAFIAPLCTSYKEIRLKTFLHFLETFFFCGIIIFFTHYRSYSTDDYAYRISKSKNISDFLSANSSGFFYGRFHYCVFGENQDLFYQKYGKLLQRCLLFSSSEYIGYLHAQRQQNIIIDKPTALYVNIAPHPWNNVVVISKDNASKSIKNIVVSTKQFFILEPGAYVIKSSFSPPVIWIIFRYIYYITILILTFLCVHHTRRECFNGTTTRREK